MHTSKSMRTAEFAFAVDGRETDFDGVLPGLTTADRVAVVTHTPGGAIAAAPLLLASVGRYYEVLRSERDDFYRYPSYFVVHVGELRGYHGALDVWADHKEVVVPSHGEAVLEALHDRAVTRVVLEDVAPADGVLTRENAQWFLEDVRDVLSFVPGEPDGPITVRPSDEAARLAESAVDASRSVLTDDESRRLLGHAPARQAFRRLSVTEGLARLCGYGPTPENLGMSRHYLEMHHAGDVVVQRHTHTVRR